MFTKFLTCLLFPVASFTGYTTVQLESKTKEDNPPAQAQVKVVDSVESFYSRSVIYLDINMANDFELYIESEKEDATQTITILRR